MDLDIVTQYILALVPAVTALTGMAVIVGVGIGKIKQANSNTLKEIKSNNNRVGKLEEQLSAVHKENAELKKELNKLLRKSEHLYTKEK